MRGKPHVCKKCREGFETREQLNRHERTAHGKRGFRAAVALPLVLAAISCGTEPKAPQEPATLISEENALKRPTIDAGPESIATIGPTPEIESAAPAHAPRVASRSTSLMGLSVSYAKPSPLPNPKAIKVAAPVTLALEPEPQAAKVEEVQAEVWNPCAQQHQFPQYNCLMVPVCSDNQDQVRQQFPGLTVPECRKAACGGVVVKDGVATPYGPRCGA